MSVDGVTLNIDITDCARDYGQRAEAIGLERRNVADLQDAKNHPHFKAAHHELLDKLAKEYRASLPLIERAPWMTVQGGTYKSKDEIVKAVTDGGHKFSDWALGLIKTDGWTLLTSSEEIEVYETTVKELTGKDAVTTTELYDVRDRLGFCDAPDETALLIRLAYKDQPMDEWRYVLSQPKADSVGVLAVLGVARRSSGSWVRRLRARPGNGWNGSARLLVCRKRPLAA